MAVRSSANEHIQTEPAAWVDNHGDALLAFAISRVTDQAVAEDLVQETFLAAWRARKSFDRRAAFRTWLIAILRRKIADHFRSQHRVPVHVDANPHDAESDTSQFDRSGRWREAVAPWQNSPSELAELREFWDVLARCVDAAPPHLGLAFRLREFDALSIDEVCRRLNITRKHLSVRLHRARLALRDCLQRNWFDQQPRSTE